LNGLGRAGEELSGRPDPARLLKAVVSWLAPCHFQALRWPLLQVRGPRGRGRCKSYVNYQKPFTHTEGCVSGWNRRSWKSR